MNNSDKYQYIFCKFNSIDEFRYFLNKKLPLTKPLNTEPLTVLILLMMLYAPVSSVEELSYFIRFPHKNSINKAFFLLQKAGKVLGATLYPHSKKKDSPNADIDSRTAKAYIITKKGFISVCEYAGLAKSDYVRLATDRYYMHTYSSGWNFYSLLFNPFIEHIDAYILEAGLTFGKRIAGDGKSLYADSIAKIGGATLYLEQDMGTERGKNELRNKLIKYGYHADYLSTVESDYIILSVRKGFHTVFPSRNSTDNPRYSPSVLKSIIDCIKWNAVFIEDITLDTLGEPSILNSQSENTRKLYCALRNDFKKHNINISTIEELESHLTGLEEFNCPQYNKEINRYQEVFAISRRNSLISNMLDDHNLGENGRQMYSDISSYVINGQHLFIVPTPLLSYYYPFITYNRSFIKEIMEKTLLSTKPFSKEFDVKTYKPRYTIPNDSSYRMEDSPILYPLTLSNMYDMPHFKIFIENLSLDLGAGMRLLAAMKCLKQRRTENNKFIVIIAMVNSAEDASYFNSLLKLHEIPNGSCFQIVFMIATNPYLLQNDMFTTIDTYRSSNNIFFRYDNEDPSSIRYVFNKD